MYMWSTGTYLGCLPLVIIKFMEGAFHKIPDPDLMEFHFIPRACLFLVPGLNKVTSLSLEMIQVMKVHHARLLQHCGQPLSCDTAVGVWYVGYLVLLLHSVQPHHVTLLLQGMWVDWCCCCIVCGHCHVTLLLQLGMRVTQCCYHVRGLHTASPAESFGKM